MSSECRRCARPPGSSQDDQEPVRLSWERCKIAYHSSSISSRRPSSSALRSMQRHAHHPDRWCPVPETRGHPVQEPARLGRERCDCAAPLFLEALLSIIFLPSSLVRCSFALRLMPRHAHHPFGWCPVPEAGGHPLRSAFDAISRTPPSWMVPGPRDRGAPKYQCLQLGLTYNTLRVPLFFDLVGSCGSYGPSLPPCRGRGGSRLRNAYLTRSFTLQLATSTARNAPQKG